MRFLVIAAVLAVALAAVAMRGADAATCKAGDLQCACAAAGGKWRDLKSPLEPTCTVGIRHQGAWRVFNVFFPKDYTPDKKYPVWVHMHGVYWSDMGDISKQMGYTVPASDATPVWDTLATGKFRERAIIVYPQATSPGGDMFKRTFWSLPFWHCSVGACIDQGVDDVAYMEKLLTLLPKRMSVDQSRIYLTGTSAGGMMLENLLCSSSLVSSKVAAAVDIIGGIGAPMRGSCKPHGKRRVPFRIVHGESDQVLRWDQATDVDGAPFLSTKEAAVMWKDLYGCSAEGERQVFSDATTNCVALCGAGAAAPLDLCGMRGVGHDLNTPFQGYPFGLAWDFLSQHALASKLAFERV
ncbi:MAG: hypothetical protein J3K34DRAFT_447686 [Monoraphidium minutum]|nr:MAG: hypothetical protein J3K34DRAFT_447686 [Monoraphidium minutum]